jgi:hypothetical protein
LIASSCPSQILPLLMLRRTGISKHRYTIRPWVKTGLPPMPIFTNSPKPEAPVVTTTAAHESHGATTRTLTTTASTPVLSHEREIAIPTPLIPSRTPRSLILRASNKTTPTRPRGKTVPETRTPDRDKDADTASVVSFTPSVSSKHLANWFSGLLGGR